MTAAVLPAPDARELAAEALRRADTDAVVLWLRHAGLSTRSSRVQLAARIMLASVLQQAGIVGLLSCARCGDRGCSWCDRSVC